MTAEQRRRGRRPKRMGDTRARILDTALRHFADLGFDKTTGLGIAREAGVDPALVLYYFHSKEDMFLEAVRARLYPRLQLLLEGSGPVAHLGERIVDGFLSLWDSEGQGRAMAALVRAGISNDRIARSFQEFVQSVVFPEISQRVGAPRGNLRVGLVAAQLLGLGLARYVLRLEPVASASREELVACVGPAITRYLTGTLPLRRSTGFGTSGSPAGRRAPPSTRGGAASRRRGAGARLRTAGSRGAARGRRP